MIPLSKTITPAIPLMPSNQKNKALHLIEIQHPVICNPGYAFVSAGIRGHSCHPFWGWIKTRQSALCG